MKLSIIIPCYNSDRNIYNILKLIHQQNRKDVEVIFVNDGSEDDTRNIISLYIENNRLTNFLLLNTPNRGAAKARELGLKKSKGEYIFFFDSDDTISSDFIDVVISNLDSRPDMLYFGSIIVSSENEKDIFSSKMIFDHNQIYCSPDKFLYDQLKKQKWTAAVWTYVFSKKLAIDAKSYFTNRQVHEDHLFTMRLLLNSKKIKAIDKSVYYQKLTKGSLTNSKKNTFYLTQRYVAYKECCQEMEGKVSFDTLLAYKKWSLKSFIYLCLTNKVVAFRGAFNRKCFYEIWKERKLIFSLFYSVLINKL